MYAQVDVVKKHFDRNNRAYQSLQVIDNNNTSHAIKHQETTEEKDAAGGVIKTAWEEDIWLFHCHQNEAIKLI